MWREAPKKKNLVFSGLKDRPTSPNRLNISSGLSIIESNDLEPVAMPSI